VVHGTLSFAQASWSHYQNTGDLFGTVSFFDGTARFIKEWWATLLEERLTTAPPVKLQTRFELYWIACKPVTMFFGEPMPVSKFKQRLISSLENRKPETRVAASVLHLIPPSVRWNIAIKTAAEGV
jgi:hypothetical protein